MSSYPPGCSSVPADDEPDLRSGLTIFEIKYANSNDRDYVAARSVIEALQMAEEHTVPLLDRDPFDEVSELPRKKWAELYINDFGDESTSFEDVMDDATGPQFIISTVS